MELICFFVCVPSFSCSPTRWGWTCTKVCLKSKIINNMIKYLCCLDCVVVEHESLARAYFIEQIYLLFMFYFLSLHTSFFFLLQSNYEFGAPSAQCSWAQPPPRWKLPDLLPMSAGDAAVQAQKPWKGTPSQSVSTKDIYIDNKHNLLVIKSFFYLPVLYDDVQRLLCARRGWTLCARNHDFIYHRWVILCLIVMQKHCWVVVTKKHSVG